MTTLLYYDELFSQHATGRHPECSARTERIWQHLMAAGLDRACVRPSWEPVSLADLQRIHRPDYLRRLQDYVAQGGGRIEVDTVVSPRSYEVAVRAAGAACDAVRRVVSGEACHALCLIRPPGHHARRHAAMGFCLINNVAVAARMATESLQVNRTLIVDWDVHHGNGTQEIFWEDERTALFSIHRWPFYPGTGAASETGQAAGLGTTRNVPVEFGTSRRDYFAKFEQSLTEFAQRTKPELILLSAGFDAHRLDPVGSLGLETEDFARLTQFVRQIADSYCGGRIVSLLEGGYNLDLLPQCVEQHLRELLRPDEMRR